MEKKNKTTDVIEFGANETKQNKSKFQTTTLVTNSSQQNLHGSKEHPLREKHATGQEHVSNENTDEANAYSIPAEFVASFNPSEKEEVGLITCSLNMYMSD